MLNFHELELEADLDTASTAAAALRELCVVHLEGLESIEL